MVRCMVVLGEVKTKPVQLEVQRAETAFGDLKSLRRGATTLAFVHGSYHPKFTEPNCQMSHERFR